MKKMIAMLLSLTLIGSMLAGCGTTADNKTASEPPVSSTSTETSQPTKEPAAETSKIDKALALIQSFASGGHFGGTGNSYRGIHPA